jgi:hypothetical protein
MNIFFDVDDTIICSLDGSLRPMVKEIFDRLCADGHKIYVWSGVGMRWTELEQHGLRQYVQDCCVKPLDEHRERIALQDFLVEPDFVVDDHVDIVNVFGGYKVKPYSGYDPFDREMLAAYENIRAVAQARASGIANSQ